MIRKNEPKVKPIDVKKLISKILYGWQLREIKEKGIQEFKGKTQKK